MSDEKDGNPTERKPLPQWFKPGVSGNPSGRPKTRSLSKAYKHKLEQLVPNEPKGRTFAELIADAMAAKAAKGDVAAAVELCERVEGKVHQVMGSAEDDEFASTSVAELEAELERTRGDATAGDAAKGAPPDGGYTQ